MPLYPPRKPYRSGYFPVTDGHKISFALFGNHRGIPVLFVHGGPGAGCNKNAHRFFDPRRFNILTVDQRGCGKSKPFASIKGNTTQNLVRDFHLLLNFLGWKKTFLFGGSWGSTLSLCYAIRYPQSVAGMVLRGIYLGTGVDDDFLLTGKPRTHFPEVWERFISHVPMRHRKKPILYYLNMIHSPDKKVAYKYCREWALYEGTLLNLEYDPKKISKKTTGRGVIAISRIEGHYFKNNCFLPKNFILQNAKKLHHIPTTIIHGRYDFVCTPEGAYNLHKAMPGSRLWFVTSGHSANDPAMREALISSLKKMTKKIRLSSAKMYYNNPY